MIHRWFASERLRIVIMAHCADTRAMLSGGAAPEKASDARLVATRSTVVRSDWAACASAGFPGEIYQRNLWGGERDDFYSGPGSEYQAASVYAERIRDLIAHRCTHVV